VAGESRGHIPSRGRYADATKQWQHWGCRNRPRGPGHLGSKARHGLAAWHGRTFPAYPFHILDNRLRYREAMMSVWLVTTGFVIATFLITKVRRYKRMPRALLDAIAADAVFGALLLLRALL
jgi:hypothetical protein